MAAMCWKLGPVHFLLCSFLLTVFSASSPYYKQAPSTSDAPLVLLVSFDGFRWDYLDRNQTPNFDGFVRDGVKARYVFDTFASKTFPNHYTIATGLYQESHGIVGNNMYDASTGAKFSMQHKLNSSWWEGGEPIWVTNQKQGGHSALIMFVGMEVKIHDRYASYRLPKYDASFPYEERVDIMTALFANGSVNLGLLYFNEPDHSGHVLGPDSPGMDAALQRCDGTLGYLMGKLKDAGLADRVDVIVTSDHGMTPVAKENFTQLDDFVDPALYYHTDNNPVIGIWPHKESDIDVIYSKLRGASPYVSVYLKDEIPAQYHYHDNSRISPILLVAKEGWAIHRGNESGSRLYKGNHGFNNSLMSMHPIFVARGPSFRQGLLAEPFENVNIYPLICHILGLEPAPNNGSLENVRDLLRYSQFVTVMTTGGDQIHTASPPFAWSTGTIVGIAVAGAILIVAACLLLAMCAKQRSYRQQPREYTPIADTSLEGLDDEIGDSRLSDYNYPNTKI